MLFRIALPHAYRALRSPNFRFYFFGLLISVIGYWMQVTAQSWLVFRLTHSSWLLGLVGFLGQLPIFTFSLLGGVVADRFSRRKLVILGQGLAMLQAFVLAFLTLTQRATIEEIIFLAAFSGMVSAFEIPARHSLMIEMVGSEALSSAIVMNSTAFMSARIIGPSLAAALLLFWNEGMCFLINAISYAAVLLALLLIRTKSLLQNSESQPPFFSLREGLSYATRFFPLRVLLILLGLVNFMAAFYSVLMPVFADKILHQGSSGLGVLMGAMGAGAFCGVFFVGSRKNVPGLTKIIAIASALNSLCVIFFAYSHSYALSIFLLLFIGMGLMTQTTSTSMLIQSMVPDRLRGRIMSIYTLMVVGVPPFGSLLAGTLAEHFGVSPTVAFAGAVCLAGAIVFSLLIPGIRPLILKNLQTNQM